MVSPELLRRYPFFASLTDEQLKALAMIANEKTYPKGAIIVRENASANKLMLLLEGDVDLIFSGSGDGAVINALVGSIAPGEILGVSSLIEPYAYICSARNTMDVKVVEIDGLAIRALMQVDSRLGCTLMSNVAAAVLERLKYTQVELAACRS
jgi:CRP/FNR family cyclic AMP-dependent transcriptional regulator